MITLNVFCACMFEHPFNSLLSYINTFFEQKLILLDKIFTQFIFDYEIDKWFKWNCVCFPTWQKLKRLVHVDYTFNRTSYFVYSAEFCFLFGKLPLKVDFDYILEGIFIRWYLEWNWFYIVSLKSIYNFFLFFLV